MDFFTGKGFVHLRQGFICLIGEKDTLTRRRGKAPARNRENAHASIPGCYACVWKDKMQTIAKYFSFWQMLDAFWQRSSLVPMNPVR
jgi:hypothetical protein